MPALRDLLDRLRARTGGLGARNYWCCHRRTDGTWRAGPAPKQESAR